MLAFDPFGGGQYQVPGGHSQKGFWTLAAGFSARARERVCACDAAVNRRERTGAVRRRDTGTGLTEHRANRFNQAACRQLAPNRKCVGGLYLAGISRKPSA